MKKQTEYRAFNITCGDEGLKLHGRLPYNTDSLDLGGFVERINPTAFKKTLQEREVKLLLNHNREQLLARTNNGSLKVYDTGDAIEWDAELVDIPENRSLWEKIKSGLYSQISFGFRCIRDRWSDRGHRELLECALEEFSIVDDAAYGSAASVSCRSLSSAYEGKELDDEAKALIQEEINKLNALVTPAEPTPEPEPESQPEEPKQEPSGEGSEPQSEPDTPAEEPKEEDNHSDERLEALLQRLEAVEKLLSEEERSLQ